MPHRAIDVPLETLPAIDDHSIEIDAPAEAAWAALFPTLTRAFDGRLARAGARRLHCAQVEASGDLHHPGGTLPGFVVCRSVAPVMFALIGEHRFAAYAIVIRIDLLPGQRSRVRLETRADFPGFKGKVYKTAVIGTRGHVIVVHGILRSLKARAERRAKGR